MAQSHEVVDDTAVPLDLGLHPTYVLGRLNQVLRRELRALLRPHALSLPATPCAISASVMHSWADRRKSALSSSGTLARNSVVPGYKK